jgi:hypothetical protein
MMATARTSIGNRYILRLDGVDAGFVQSFEGGDIVGEVVSSTVGTSEISRKHIGSVRYEPITLEVSIPINGPLRDWVYSFMNLNIQHKNGSIIVADYDYNAVKEIEFSNALISEVGFPAADASAKEAAYLTVKIRPEFTRSKKTGGKINVKPAIKQKGALVSNFRLNIDGLDCSKVAKVSGLTVRQTFSGDELGSMRDYELLPTSVEFSNLAVTFAAASAKSWEDWFEDFVIKGNSGQDQEKSGSITYLSPDLKGELLTIELSNLGIFSLKSEKAENTADQVPRMTAQLYCEQMKLAKIKQ